MNKPLVLSVDDDESIRRLIERFLTNSGYNVITADNGENALLAIRKTKPDIILLDITMPGMDGYEVCSRLQENEETASIPVIFVTALGEEQDKAKAFSVGGVDYLVKPIQKDTLIQKVRSHLKRNIQWKKLQKEVISLEQRIAPTDFLKFKNFLSEHLNLPSEKRDKLSSIPFSKIYSFCPEIGITNAEMARLIASFLKLPYLSLINPYDIQLGVLPTPFCKKNSVAAIRDESGNNAFVLSNPFDWQLLGLLDKVGGEAKAFNLVITEPDNIELLFKDKTALSERIQAAPLNKEIVVKVSEAEIEAQPIIYITNNILNKAVDERASDIHIEPKETNTVVRFRVDGDLRDVFALKKDTAVRVITRFKAIGGLDIAERRRPQDGSLSATINNKTFKLRLATTSTPHGESIIIRLLEQSAKPKSLEELGMTAEQAEIMANFINRTQGLILIVGPTGSGKTTTIHSLLSMVDCQTRSLISVEDPIEYRIPFANQQEVNEKAGITFESLLRSAVRQDPDILFLGEIRDPYSAKMAVNFASTGHLTITTLHTSNATTAIFRLERLGIDRGAMADSILCIVAQRLVKRLCPYCKEVVPISQEEREMLSMFTEEIPSKVAHPIGCVKCNNTGYYGREGVYEIMQFDPEISEMIRSGIPISEIRNFSRKRGDYLISDHGMEKIKSLICSPKDIYGKVLSDDTVVVKGKRPREEIPEIPSMEKNILIVDDDKDTQKLISRLLENSGYKVTLAEDGIDALLHLGKKEFNLIISAINMPKLDGFNLLEARRKKGVETPIIFLTSSTSEEDEIKALELDTVDYIKKPIQKELLLLRVKKILED